jgi:hypothetical protein
VKLKVRHVYDFGVERRLVGPDLITPDAWDAIRDTSTAFGLPRQREDWERLSVAPDVVARAREIAAVAARVGAGSLCSYGVGTGVLERALHRVVPEVRLTCADYTPRTVRRLQLFFPEAEVVGFDLRNDQPIDADLSLMHRLDAELDDDEWRRVFERFEKPILFVPNLLLGPRRVAIEIFRRLAKPSASMAGWYRSEDALRSLWTPTHEDTAVDVAGSAGFLLTRR